MIVTGLKVQGLAVKTRAAIRGFINYLKKYEEQKNSKP